jgi:hypothetical protein
MKKLILSLAVAGMFAFVACGPSAEEVAEQARLDSLRADSIAKAQADSIAALTPDTLVVDSLKTEEVK